MAPVVSAYYVELRSVMRSKPWLRKCQARCWQCGIFFLTDRRNAGREDLGCPFGCSREHRRRKSTQRSVEYYRSPEGKAKKKAINARRRLRGRKASTGAGALDPMAPSLRVILGYLCVLVGLVEGRRVQRRELIQMLERTRRQHRMVRTRRLDQGVAWFNERPP